MSIATPVRMGLLGTGRFGQFCLDQYLTVPGVEVVAVADTDHGLAEQVAQAHGLPALTPEDLLTRADLDLVYLGTPPATHAQLALIAIRHGRHVLCEKPLALDLPSATAVIAEAREAQLLLPVNLVMRYDPLCQAVARILASGVLGEPLHAFFENYANDEVLPADHWFWDSGRSGGIFIEHGVHFFDLFSLWFGPGRVTGAQQVERPGSAGKVEQVACTASYGDVHVSFYHGFHQAQRMDRQELRIVCERGSIRLFEWIPTMIEIDCLANTTDLQTLLELVPHARHSELEHYEGEPRRVTSRHKPYEVDGRFLVAGDLGVEKMTLYGQAVRALLADQVAAIRDPGRARLVTEENGLASLQMALRATELAAGRKPR